MIRKLAATSGENCDPQPEKWFRQKFGADANYSQWLDLLAKSPTERQRLLREYFEPTEEERKQGIKTPTKAHRALAELIASGYVRVILTTNFDRLLEHACEDVSVTPTVVSTSDQIAGALPLVHSGPTIIKLHGDYLDTRIRNTDAELGKYEPKMVKLLDRVLDEFGLIVSGWSGDWDPALRAAIDRCPSRRFTIFWTTRSPLKGQAERLAKHRKAQVLSITDADTFVVTLAEKVKALESLKSPHPLSAKMAAAMVKRYLPDPAHRIRLHDLVHDETEKLVTEIGPADFPAHSDDQPATELNRRLAKYEALSSTLIAMCVPGSFWGTAEQSRIWSQCVERIANTPSREGGTVYLLNLRRYPALLLLYASGLAALAGRKFETVCALFTNSKARDDDGREQELVLTIYPWAIEYGNTGKLIAGKERRHTPISDHLYERLRDPLREFVPRDEEFDRIFDDFEYLLGTVHADISRQDLGGHGGWWGPAGRFAWRRFRGSRTRIETELSAMQKEWPLLKAGFFGGSFERALEAQKRFDTFVSKLGFY